MILGKNYFNSTLTSYFTGASSVIWIEVLKKYVWDDFEFIGFLAVLIIADTATGILVAIKEKKFNSKCLGNAVTKIFVISFSLIAIHSISSISQLKQHDYWLGDLASYLDSLLYGFIAIREFLSINENCSRLGYPLMPTWVLRLMKTRIKKRPP